MKKKKKQVAFLSICPVEGVLNKVINYALTDNDFLLSSIEDIIYNDHILAELRSIAKECTNGRKRELAYRFIIDLNNKRTAKVVTWLFKNRINKLFETGDKKEKTPVDDKFIGVIKELLWVSYYIRNKPAERLKIIGSPIDILSRLQGVYLDGNSIIGHYNANREEYIDNIISLKNAQLTLLPYPSHIDLGDLEALLEENGVMTKRMRELIEPLHQIPFTPYERYHIFDFIRTAVKEKLEEKSNGRITKNNKYFRCVDATHSFSV